MATSVTSAISAYVDAASAAGRRLPGLEPREGVDGAASFGEVMRQAAAEAVETVRASEQTSAAAVVGQADLTDVVTAVSNAEMTLQTVVAVRDRVITAYQEILRMPI